MARNLETDMEILRTVLSHAQNRDFERAAALAEATLASGFEHPVLLNVLATRLEQAGRLDDALRLLERAVSVSPGDVGARNALALCLQRLDRPAEALEHVEVLLQRHPELGFAHANKGNALVALGLLGQAKLSHERALQLEPANFASMAALAAIATHRGDHAEARQWAQRTLSACPGFPEAVMSLAAADLADGATARAEALLHGLIIDSRAGAAERARATGLLGDVLDAAGRRAEAFDAYVTCNDALRQLHAPRMAGSGILVYTRSLKAAAAGLAPEGWTADDEPDPGDAGPRGHVFLIGFPRSGTTLLEVLLDGHPHVASLEEHELLTDGVVRFMQEPLDLGPLSRADPTSLAALRAAYWHRVAATGTDVNGKVFIDKHPLNSLKLPLIARLFPRARILFAVRDPRDVVLSCFRRRFKMNAAMYQMLTLEGAAAFYDAVLGFAYSVGPQLKLAWQTVRHEALVADPDAETRAVCDFLGLDPVDDMMAFGERVSRREHATPSTAQLRGGLNASGMGHWRHYQSQLAPVLSVLMPWVERLGYRE